MLLIGSSPLSTHLKEVDCLVVASCKEDASRGMELHRAYHSLSSLDAIGILHPFEVNGPLW